MAHAVQPASVMPGRMVLPALSLGSFIAMLTFGAPVLFLPDISRELGVSVPVLGQVTTSMLVLSAPLGLVAGPAADHFGARRLMLPGLAAAAACLLIFGLAPIFPILFLASIAGALSEERCPGCRWRSREPGTAVQAGGRSGGRSGRFRARRSLACPCSPRSAPLPAGGRHSWLPVSRPWSWSPSLPPGSRTMRNDRRTRSGRTRSSPPIGPLCTMPRCAACSAAQSCGPPAGWAW